MGTSLLFRPFLPWGPSSSPVFYYPKSLGEEILVTKYMYVFNYVNAANLASWAESLLDTWTALCVIPISPEPANPLE